METWWNKRIEKIQIHFPLVTMISNMFHQSIAEHNPEGDDSYSWFGVYQGNKIADVWN